MGINLERKYKSWSITDVIKYESITDSENFSKALSEIDGKLNKIKKEITY